MWLIFGRYTIQVLIDLKKNCEDDVVSLVDISLLEIMPWNGKMVLLSRSLNTTGKINNTVQLAIGLQPK